MKLSHRIAVIAAIARREVKHLAAAAEKRAAQAEAQAAQWREWLGTAEQAVQHR